MKYSQASYSVDFEIPDEWFIEAGVKAFKPQSLAYHATSDSEYPTTIIKLSEVIAPVRNEGVAHFNKERMVSLFKGALSEQAIPPIETHKKPGEEKLRIRDGFHRFYMSVALGFKALPVSVRPYFDINEL